MEGPTVAWNLYWIILLKQYKSLVPKISCLYKYQGGENIQGKNVRNNGEVKGEQKRKKRGRKK